MTRGKAASTSAERRILGKSEFKTDGKLDSPSPLAQPPKCPECTSQKVWKDGLRRTRNGDIQRWLCRACGFRFSESTTDSQVKINVSGQVFKQSNPRKNLFQANVFQSDFSIEPFTKDPSFKSRKNVTSHRSSGETTVEKVLNTFGDYNRECRVCVSDVEAKNLVGVEAETAKAEAGAASKLSKADIKGKIIEFAWKLNSAGYAESTVRDYSYILGNLVKKGVNLFDPDSVKKVIAQQKTWSAARKYNVVKAYTRFLKTQGLTWTLPRYQPVPKLPFIPLEKELDDLIAGCSRQMTAFLLLLKETGARCGEAFQLKREDVDFVTNTVRITPEKRSNPRIFKISTKLAITLGNLHQNLPKIFTYKNTFYLRKTFQKQRKRVAHKLGDPRILRIHFHTFRHWKATMEYHKTKDILHVMQILGHKNIKNTLIYVQLAETICKGEDEYVCKVAKDLKEATKLIEAGFEYVTDMNGYKIFRKRK